MLLVMVVPVMLGPRKKKKKTKKKKKKSHAGPKCFALVSSWLYAH